MTEVVNAVVYALIRLFLYLKILLPIY
uniref:Uncharacterized protein n=1 Tax=Anguilla anguilla TaxID=7936 RepID=A0A0E9U6W4_ANGAN